MASRKFVIAFSSIATLAFPRFLALVWRYPVDVRYYLRCLIAGIISMVIEPFRWLEKLVYDRRLTKTRLPKSPVFILGHWRSGTTLLHNAMCQDKQFAYINTYQSVFTNQFFFNRWLFKPLMRLLIPDKRPADNVHLSVDFPQEEEIALCNTNSFSFYNFFYFPRQWKIFYQQYISGKTSSASQLDQYSKRYKKVIAQALIEYGREEFISKNPSNTGRIRHLLKMFPEAKFIYIYRNPVKVYLSTVNFFQVTVEALQLQCYSRAEFEELVFELHEQIIRDYEEQKSLIPKENLVEVKYEDFEQDPITGLESIYSAIGLPGFEQARPAFEAYLESQKRFEKGHHPLDEEVKQKILQRCAYTLNLYGYAEVPSEL